MLVIGGGDGEGRWLGAPYAPHKHFGLEVVVVVRARTMLRPSSYLGDAILPCTYILYYVYLPNRFIHAYRTHLGLSLSPALNLVSHRGEVRGATRPQVMRSGWGGYAN